MKKPAKQFVIQRHTTPDGLHWDLMLEMDDTLWTWRLNVPPAEIGNAPIEAERIHDHPLRFLTYEGPVQNKTGTVVIADRGTYACHEQTENTLRIDVRGKSLTGQMLLSQLNNTSLWELCIK